MLRRWVAHRPVSCLGYAVAAHEIIDQEHEMGLRFDAVALPNGSSGTHAGLIAGLVSKGERADRVVSYTVLAPRTRPGKPR